ncbi:MAG TPA: OmpA family protein [Acidobacteriota bacterium]|nr:OmpA family protein [Acidobacteriota bacterium]
MKKSALLLLIATLSTALWAQEVQEQLNVVRFPERKSVQIEMLRSTFLPDARMKAKMEFKEGQMRIEVEYDNMKPAVLFGGDVTAYVLWAVNRDGGAENLGELWVRPQERDDKVRYSTGLRTFALMVTGEPYYQVSRPSAMVIFKNAPSSEPQAPSSQLTYNNFSPAPRRGFDNLSPVDYDGDKPLDVVQAEKVYQLAQELGAREYAPDIMSEASLTLRQSQQMARSSRSRGGAREFARKSVASSNEAIKITLRRKQAEELERQIAQRQARMEELREEAESARARAESAQADAEEAQAKAAAAEERAQRIAAQSQQEISRLQSQQERLRAEQASLENEKRMAENAVRQARQELERLEDRQARLNRENAQLEQALEDLRQERETLRAGMQDLREEKETLEGRLQNALSQVADTRNSARGFIVNLPDILFDTNKADLKPQARLVLAKLAGILLIMQDLNLRIEGHTDSTGTASYNLRLSQERADSVLDFLAEQGLASTRMKAVGYGLDRPIADNSTARGRQQNRRVEIVIAEGVVAEESR